MPCDTAGWSRGFFGLKREMLAEPVAIEVG